MATCTVQAVRRGTVLSAADAPLIRSKDTCETGLIGIDSTRFNSWTGVVSVHEFVLNPQQPVERSDRLPGRVGTEAKSVPASPRTCVE